MRYEKTVEIAATPDRVWAIWNDIPNWPSWTATMKSVEPLDSGPLRFGYRTRLDIVGAAASIWTVTEFEEGKAFAWSANVRGVHSTARHAVEAAGEGARVLLAVEYHGVMAALFRPMIGRTSVKNLEIESAGLKRRCETP